MDIQRAEPEQAPRLKQVAVAAKGYWGYSDAWMQRWGSLFTLAPEYIRAHDVYVAIDSGAIIGFYALIHHGDLCELDHLWVVPERIGTGVGRALLAHALQRARAAGATRMEWEADPHAVGFYQRMGGRYLRERDTELEGPLPIMGLDLEPSASAAPAPRS